MPSADQVPVNSTHSTMLWPKWVVLINVVGTALVLIPLTILGSRIYGFVGMLVAVPVAAALGVVARFAVEQYKSSLLYQGMSGRDDG